MWYDADLFAYDLPDAGRKDNEAVFEVNGLSTKPF
jgi:hypothetical protein